MSAPGLPPPDPLGPLFEKVRTLYLRLKQLDLSTSVSYRVEETRRGVEFEFHVVAGSKADAMSAKGSTPGAAAHALIGRLAGDLTLRVKGDVSALTLAGFEFDWGEGYGRHVRHPGAVDEAPAHGRKRRAPEDATVIDTVAEVVTDALARRASKDECG